MSLTKIIIFESSTSGFDKTIRLLTYGLKLFNYFYLKKYEKNDWIEGLNNIQNVISDIRSSLRLPGMFTTIKELKDSNEIDFNLKMIRMIQNVIMLIYYPSDHFSFFIKKKFIPIIPDHYSGIFSRFACKCWSICIILDFLSDFYKLYYHNDYKKEIKKREIDTIDNINEIDEIIEKEKKNLENKKLNELSKTKLEKKIKEIQKKKIPLQETLSKIKKEYDHLEIKRENIYLTLIVNICNLPMAIEWSRIDPYLPEIGIPFIGLIGSYFSFYLKWKSLK